MLEISDGEIGTIPGKKIQILSQLYATCRKRTNDLIRQLETVSNQYAVYQTCKSDLRKWTKNIVHNITDLDQQVDTVESIPECQQIVSEIETMLIDKQEGEVRVHVVLGKGEKISNTISSIGRVSMQEEMTTIKDAYEELVDRILSLRSKSEVKLSELVNINKCCIELDATLNDIKSILTEDKTLPNDFKEKKSKLEKLEELQSDLDEVEIKLQQTETKVFESGYQTIDETNASLQLSSSTLKPISLKLEETKELLLEQIEIAADTRDRHERWIVSGDELEEWIQSAKEELSRWSDLSQSYDKAQLKKKMIKIEELMKAKMDGLARLDATRILAKDLEHETSLNGYELIAAEMKQQENQWVEWEGALAETESNIFAAITELEEYQDGFRAEKIKLEHILTEFENSCRQITIPVIKPDAIGHTIQELVAHEQTLKKIGSEVTLIRTRLNVLCRKFSNEDANDISNNVSVTLNSFSTLKSSLLKVRNDVENSLRSQFKTKSTQFDSFIRKFTAQLQQYSTPRGDLDQAAAFNSHLLEIGEQSIEQGQHLLQELNDLADSSSALFSSEQVNLNRSTIRQLKEKWKHFISELDEATQALDLYIKGLNDFDKNCFELYHWIEATDKRLKSESGLKATIGLKKSQLAAIQAVEEESSDEQYKFARLKRKAVRVQYPGGTIRVGELQTSYRALCNRAVQAKRDASNRLQHHVQLINDISTAEEWIKQRQDNIDQFQPNQNLSTVRVEIEKRLNTVRRIGNEQQTGEGLVHAAIGRSDSVLAGTSSNGKHAVQLQIQSLQEVWNTCVNSQRHTEERLALALQNWCLWEDAMSAAESWLHKAAKNLDEKHDQTSDSDNSEAFSPTLTIHRLKTIVEDCHHHGKFFCIEQLEKQTVQLVNIVGPQENARNKQQAVAARYASLLSIAERKLKSTHEEVNNIQDKIDTVRSFTDWIADQRPTLAGFFDPVGSIAEVQKCIQGLKAMESDIIPTGDSKCLHVESENDDNHPIIDEWLQLKEHIRNGISTLEETQSDLVQLNDKVSNFSVWIEEANGLLEDTAALRIDISQDGKNNAFEVVQNLTSLMSNCESKRKDQEYLSSQASSLVEKCRLELSITVQIAELSAKYQNLVGKMKVRLASARASSAILDELSQKMESFDSWMHEANTKYSEAANDTTIRAPGEQLVKTVSTINELINECENRRGGLLGLTEKCARAVASGINSPLSIAAKEQIQRQGSSLQEDFQELYGKLQVAQRRFTKIKAHWSDYDDAQQQTDRYLSKIEKRIKNVLADEKVMNLSNVKIKQEEVNNFLEEYGRQKEQIIEAEFRLGKLPLEIQDRVAPHFYRQQNIYRDIGRDLRKKGDDIKTKIDKFHVFLGKLQSSEKTMLQLNQRIGSLQEQLLNDNENPSERESQAKILLQDVEGFQQTTSELRASDVEPNGFADITPLSKTASTMHQKVTELLGLCQKAIQESVERKSEFAEFQQILSKA